MEKTDSNDSVYSKLARAALEECEERFRIFMEATKEGVVIHDRFKILETNQAFADMFSFKLANILGRDVLEFIAPDSRDLIMGKLLAGDEGPIEVSGVKKDGTDIPIEFCSRIITHGGNRINLTLCRQSRTISKPNRQERMHLTAWIRFLNLRRMPIIWQMKPEPSSTSIKLPGNCSVIKKNLSLVKVF